MKQAYFTTKNIVTKSSEFLRSLENDFHVHSLNNQLPDSALLVLDMQDYFLDPGSHAFVPSGPAIIPGINRLVNHFQQCGRPVIFTQHINSIKDASLMNSWWKELITNDNPLVRITPLIASESAQLIVKSQYDAFFNTELETLLHSFKIRDLIICGLMTHLCCETSARSAFVRGFNVIFPVDGTATYNEQFHLATLRNLAHGFAVITTTDQIITAARTPQ